MRELRALEQMKAKFPDEGNDDKSKTAVRSETCGMRRRHWTCLVPVLLDILQHVFFFFFKKKKTKGVRGDINPLVSILRYDDEKRFDLRRRSW